MVGQQWRWQIRSRSQISGVQMKTTSLLQSGQPSGGNAVGETNQMSNSPTLLESSKKAQEQEIIEGDAREVIVVGARPVLSLFATATPLRAGQLLNQTCGTSDYMNCRTAAYLCSLTCAET